MTPATPILPPAGGGAGCPEMGGAVDHGAELKRGMFFNTIALLASNFRGVFTFLIARLLGAAALGTFLVAWATTDVLSKIAMFGLDNTIIAFIARSEAAGERARSRALFHLAVALALGQSTVVAAISILVVRFAGDKLNLNPQMVSVLSVLLCAMPGVILYRVCTAVSRGMRVMKHDIFSRGVTESAVTTLAFLATVALGWKTFGPAIASIIGTAASGLVALYPGVVALPFRAVRSWSDFLSVEARRLLSYAASISGYDLLNSLIVRLDVIMLGCFIGHAPGVTLPAVGIYGAVVEVGSGLRKVNQAFNPIFAPLVAGMTAQRRAGTCRGRLLARCAMDALDSSAPSRGHGAGWLGHPQHLWSRVSSGRNLARHRRARLRHELLCRPRRDCDHGATAAAQSPQLRYHGRDCGGCELLADQVVRRNRRRLRHSFALRSPRDSAPPHFATGIWMAATVEQHRSASHRGLHRRATRNCLSLAPPWRGRTDYVSGCFSRRLRPRMAAPLSAQKKLI